MKKIIKNILIISIILINVKTYNVKALDCNNILKKGSKGKNVVELQEILNEKISCNLALDGSGSFGNLTKNCVIKYQRENNLEQDGIVGPITCNSLNSTENNNNVIKTYEKSELKKGIIIGSKVNIRKSPTTTSKVIYQVKRGDEVIIHSKKGNWYYVEINKTYGYIRSDLLTINTIVVDIDEQILYFYKEGNLSWTTNVVTGNSKNHDTPTGSYKLNRANFRTETYLKGYNDDGTKYNSYVDYWMPFITDKGIGFHDASWRKVWEYNKERYINNGSHGCVNMQHEAAEKLYNEDFDIIDVIVRD